jgi:hypothetical protein
MLEFIVRTYLDAPEDLKELTIGLEVFEEDDFDPQKSAKVRRTAGRLRAKLAQYYQTEGRNDPIEIDIPKGHYAPLITVHESRIEMSKPLPGAPEHKRSLRIAWACGALVLLAVFLAGLRGRVNENEKLGSPVRLTFEAGLARSPAISRNGGFVVYACDRGSGGNMVLWNQDLNNGTKHQITTGKDDDYDPDISADGKTIVFRSERDGGGIYKVASTGGAVQSTGR